MKNVPIDGNMPILGHIMVLRRLLIVSIGAVIGASAVAFMLYDGIIGFLYRPFEAL